MSDFLGLAQTLQLAVKAMLMYTANHPRTQTSLANLAAQVGLWLEEKPNVHIAASLDKVFLDGAPFEGKSIHLTALAKQFNDRQISGFILQRGVTPEELAVVVELLILKPARIEEAGGAAAFLAKKHLLHVQLSQTQYREVREGEGGEADQGGPGANSQASSATEAAVTAAATAAMAALAAAAQQALAGGQQGLGNGQQSLGNGLQGSGSGQQGLGNGLQGFGGAQQGFGAGQQGSALASLSPSAPALDMQLLTDLWEDQLELLPQPSLLTSSHFTPASLGFLGGTPLSFGMGDSFPPAHQVEALRGALLKLPPSTLLSVVAGLESLPTAPAGMRMGFQALASQAFSHAASDLMASELPWENTKEAIFNTLRYAPQQQSMLAALEAELRSRGLGMEIVDRFQELIQQLDWETLTMEERLRLTLVHGQLWKLTLEQRLGFLLRLLEEGRTEPFLKLLDQILELLAGEAPLGREHAATTLAGVTRWMQVPGLPVEAEGPLLQGLTAHFGWEPHVHIHRATTEALDTALGCLVNRGEPGLALSLLQELAGLCDFHDSYSEWRAADLSGLWGRLADPVSLRKVVELLHTANPETMLNELIPYLEAAGEAAPRLLVEVLGEEPDRKRRGRLIEAIRGLGEPALPALYAGLEAPTWYLVRNTLNLLADMGDAGALPAVERCLSHQDGRVKRAAVRCLWKICGPAAVPSLLKLFPSVDAETQMEIIFALGQLRSTLSLPVLTAFAQERRTPEALRVRAAETLGQIGDAQAIPALTELAVRKGRFFSTAEPTALRLAACRALLAIGTPAALMALRGVVAAEPWNKERALLQQVLETPLK